MTPRQYLDHIARRAAGPPPFVSGLCGRITRGQTEPDFERLSDDPNRLVVMLTDAAGLAKLLGCASHYQMLMTIGHHPDHVRGKLTTTPPHRYRLVVFPEAEAVPGTWAGVLRVAADVYPDLEPYCRRHASALLGPALGFRDGRTTAFAALEERLGFRLADVDHPGHAQFMSYEHWLESSQSPDDLRRLFYHTLHLRELYAGDGYTYDASGRRQLREYLLRNLRVADIAGAAWAPLAVTLP